MLPIWRVYVEVLVPELKKHGIPLDESIVSSLMSHRGRIDGLHYVMYRLDKKENGLQIFYRCLRETQKECLHHGRFADKIESKGIMKALKCKTLGGIHMHHALDLTGCVYAFAGNTCPHGQANLRTCSVASHCGHTFLRPIDIPDCRFRPTVVSFQVHVSSP